jgi:hypothetical protein
VNTSVHPNLARDLDPYLQLGASYLAGFDGKLQYNPQPSRWGVEGKLGLNFAWPHVAFGPCIVYGQSGRDWVMLEVHVEARL